MSIQDRMSSAIIEVIKREGLSNAKLANALGVNRNTINNYRLKKSAPSPHIVDKFCEAYGVNKDWIYTGRGHAFDENRTSEIDTVADGPVPPGEILDRDVLQQVIEGVEEGLAERKIKIDPAKKAELIALLYDHFSQTGKNVSSQDVDRYLRLVA